MGPVKQPKDKNKMKDLLQTFLAKRGQFLSVTWQRPVKTLKAFAGLNIQKRVEAHSVRAGVNYDAMNNVQEKRENGELPVVNQGLPWGEWEIFPHVIKHKTNRYFRFSTAGNSTFKRQFLLDGEPVEFDSIKEMILASEKTEKDELDVFNVKEESVLEMS